MRQHSFIFSIILVFSVLLPFNLAVAQPPENFADIVEKLMPSVVNISTTQKPNSSSQQNAPLLEIPPGSPLEEYRDFFEKFYDALPKEGDEGLGDGRKMISLGSGFIIDSSGYIVTNNHVVGNAEEISVTLSDDTQLDAKLVGRDAKTDLALLKVEAKKPLPAVQFGDSDKARVGEWVIAIGNPFGLGGTVTAGIISARARDINAGPFDDFIQTDASINKGNSGGPMFNAKGEVIGINTAIYSPSGGSIGIGFATPSDMARPVIEELRKHGRIRRAWLGVKIQNVSEDIAESLGQKEKNGALVADVTPGSPADKAGITVGDIIIGFDGKDILAMRKLPRIVADTPIGKTVNVTLLHKGIKKTTRVTLVELTESVEALQAGLAPKTVHSTDSASELLDMSVAPLNSQLRMKYGVATDVKGLLVTRVKKPSDAADRGVQPGDVVVAINQDNVADIKTAQTIIEAAKSAKKKFVLLLVNHQGDTRFIPLPLSSEVK